MGVEKRGVHPTEPPSPTRPTRVRESAAPCCGRCGAVIERIDREAYFARTGLCFWCAYIDSQG